MSDEIVGSESAVSAPAPSESAASTPESLPTSSGSGLPTQDAAPPAYTPNYKFNHLGKEHELDEWARPLLKDPELEKKFKEMYQKAYGMDHYKSIAERERNEHGKTRETAEKFTSLDKELKMLGGYLAKKDFTSLFKNINVSEQDVFQWVQNKLHERGLPPEQQAQIRTQEMERERLYYLEQQTQDLQSRMEQQQVQARTYELEGAISRPEVQSFASSYDAMEGKPGAFKQAVIEHGAFLNRMQGVDLTVEQAVQGVMAKYGKFMNPQGATASSPQGNREPPPVIPHVAGKATSPVKKKARTLADLRELEKTM